MVYPILKNETKGKNQQEKRIKCQIQFLNLLQII